jgi:hypothetical protein
MSSGRSRHWDGGLVVSFGTAHSAVLGGIGIHAIQAIQAIQAIRLRAAVPRGPILLSNARLQTWLKTRQKRLG